jgi:hypothetical protein
MGIFWLCGKDDAKLGREALDGTGFGNVLRMWHCGDMCLNEKSLS